MGLSARLREGSEGSDTIQGIDETHLRTVGLLSIRSDQVAASEQQDGAIGMILATDQALSVGITAVPHPITDADDDGWILYQPFSQAILVGDATGFNSHGAVQYHFDTKAKRIIHDGSAIALVLQNSSSTGIIFSIIMRTLTMVRGT